jgi:hypothetical protein
MSDGGPAPRRPSRLERAQERLAYWQSEAAGVERDARVIGWFPRVGVVLAALAAAIHILAAVGVGAFTLLAWAMGQYMVRVRRAEFAHHVRDAQAELDEARRAV